MASVTRCEEGADSVEDGEHERQKRRKAPFVDDPAAVVDESVRANVIAIVRPTSRGVIRLHDGENDERETACSREYQVRRSPRPEVKVRLIQGEEVDDQEDKCETHRHSGEDEQQRLAEEHSFEGSRAKNRRDQRDYDQAQENFKDSEKSMGSQTVVFVRLTDSTTVDLVLMQFCFCSCGGRHVRAIGLLCRVDLSPFHHVRFWTTGPHLLTLANFVGHARAVLILGRNQTWNYGRPIEKGPNLTNR